MYKKSASLNHPNTIFHGPQAQSICMGANPGGVWPRGGERGGCVCLVQSDGPLGGPQYGIIFLYSQSPMSALLWAPPIGPLQFFFPIFYFWRRGCGVVPITLSSSLFAWVYSRSNGPVHSHCKPRGHDLWEERRGWCCVVHLDGPSGGPGYRCTQCTPHT